jgi:D-glycero-D-manno-heptose 1,7-bisphosphate phosphatase
MTGDDARPRTALFLDRDGVINRKPLEGAYISDWSEFEFLPGAVAAMVALHGAGAELVVVTNQRGVARGILAEADLAEIHAKMSDHLAVAGAPLAGLYVCPHELESCDCRKPALGLFRQAQRDYPWITFADSQLVGDSLSDLEAGRQLGMGLWLVGDEPRRAAVAVEADRRGISILGEARSLSDLVAAGRLLAQLDGASVGG